ncbi:MAG: polyphosphate kinase 1 [Deltaproteobacteria bacterium]|nr:polyphosphate kinase 1 [Deltaproteobacteria bacterium]
MSTNKNQSTATNLVSLHKRALDDFDLYLNRELSSLQFNARVLQLAQDPSVPLLERLRYLSIFSSNLDEFFEVRVAGLKEREQLDLASPYPDGSHPTELLRKISDETHALIEQQYRTLNKELLPALAAEGIRLLRRDELDKAQSEWLRRYFQREVLPVLSPIGLDPAHPFPIVQNKGLNFVVKMSGHDAYDRDSGLAIIPVPRCLPRLIHLPAKLANAEHHFVMLSSLIHGNVDLIFPGMEVYGCHQFRITRNSDMWVDEDEVDDLLSALKGELHGRNYGRAVRLEVADNCEKETQNFLLDQHNLTESEMYQVKGPVNLHRVSALADFVDRPDLKFAPTTPSFQDRLGPKADPMAAMVEGPVLLHHPYESYAPVVSLIARASNDPKVLAIKITLYRTGDDSPIVDSLINAARNGKEVTVVVELRARFDEAANIRLATKLQEAGATVAYGVVGRKCHAKMLLIVRREGRSLRRYVHLATGNYHTGTSRLYTDFSLLSAEPEIGEDVHNMFMQLTSLGEVMPMHRLLHAPFTLKSTLLELIEAEIEAAKAGKKAHIKAKLNSLSEPKMIQALYRASQAGVHVSLVVRGICCLKPGIPGVSENIHVRSILGRFLEHSRVYNFHANGQELVFISSADWMDRNLLRRVEFASPIVEPKIKARVIHEGLDQAFTDNVNAWVLQSDGSYNRASSNNEKAHHVQQFLLDLHSD